MGAMDQQAEAPRLPQDGRYFIVTSNAAKRVAKIRELEGNPDMMLRVSVEGGGCSGFQYVFDFDREAREDDFIFVQDGVGVLVDTVSLDLLDGSELDFVEDLMGAYFRVNNPNASSGCGCGTSFAIG